ncbi:hypothetical protein [Kitasatospora sp. NPDC088783]|uniref:hypothetical protein n=1 Tax=Kitasatospora sp. NPDC088783 TaxID=3364077 RepID=UPI0037F8A6CF
MTDTAVLERRTAEQLAAMTPSQVDHWASDIAAALEAAHRVRGRLLDSVHYAVGDRRRQGRGVRWVLTDGQAERQAAEMLAAGTVRPWEVSALTAGLEELEANRALIADLEKLSGLPDAEWRRRGMWSRFFLVTSSAGGHIHSSTACGSTRFTTTFVWLPDLAGSTEEQAVAAQGPLLCTRCFPTAPLEWTRGTKQDRPKCDGASELPEPGTARRRGMKYWGKCTGCDETFELTTAGRIRRHGPRPAAA